MISAIVLENKRSNARCIYSSKFGFDFYFPRVTKQGYSKVKFSAVFSILAKIDLKLDYVGRLGKRENRECVYQFVAPDDERDSIFGQWFNRDELFSRDSVSVSNNKDIQTPVIDTTSQLIPKNTELVSGTNSIDITTPVIDTTSHHIPQTSDSEVLEWKGLKLKMQQGLDSVDKFYQQLVSQVGSAVGIADGEPYWNAYLGQWQIWVNVWERL
ncbi:hypothetical protein [Nostoc sp.]